MFNIKLLPTPEARELKRKISRALAKDPENKKILEGLQCRYKNRKKKNEESTD